MDKIFDPNWQKPSQRLRWINPACPLGSSSISPRREEPEGARWLPFTTRPATTRPRHCDASLSGLGRILSAGGFKAYERAHREALTRTLSPKFALPPELVRTVVEFYLHAGFYPFTPAKVPTAPTVTRRTRSGQAYGH